MLIKLVHSTNEVSKRAVASSAAARLLFEILFSGRVVPFGAPPTMKFYFNVLG
jgi:hypothetical protein